MALYTVGFNAESRFVIVAAAARFALLHLAHTVMPVAGPRNKEIRMAILAAVSGHMRLMAEHGAAGTEIDLLYRMAFLAVRFHTEGGLAVVTGTARTPLLHIGHGGALALFSGFEYAVVALNAFVHARMHRMAEGCIAGLLELVDDIHRRFMAGAAITLYAENGRAVVTGTARCPLLHLGHGETPVVRTGVVQLVMAIAAGIHSQVFVMVKPGIVRKQHFLDRVAFAAGFDTEGRRAVMACSA